MDCLRRKAMRHYRIAPVALALAALAGLGATAQASHCGACRSSCAPAPLCERLFGPRVCYETVWEERSRVCYRPVYTTVLKECKSTVCELVTEQCVREQH